MKLVLVTSNEGYLLEALKDSVILVVTDRVNSPVIKKAEKLGIKVEQIHNNIQLEFVLESVIFDRVIIGDYPTPIPKKIAEKFSIYSTHHSLLPSYAQLSGKKLYDATINNKDEQTGITLQKETGDQIGHIIAKHPVIVSSEDTIESLERKMKIEEMKFLYKFFKSKG